MNEFELIREYFVRQPVRRGDVVLGIGDDAAVLDVPSGRQLVVSTDLLVSGVHFPAGTDARAVGHKALAVNLSDLAAMGAEPAWFTLNLSLPEPDAAWLEGFCHGLFELACRHDVALIGGDTTRGPLTIGVQIMGFVEPGQALTRAGARAGDEIYVTGTLGDAALGLRLLQGEIKLPEEFHAAVLTRLERPAPRVGAGRHLRGLATSCIDVSDGLAADLGHILEASGVGARLELARLPLSLAYDPAFAQVGWEAALAGGDDYELCFTVPPARVDDLHRAAALFGVPCTRVGVIESEPGLRIVDPNGAAYVPKLTGFDHFRGD
jgi:thiamine-monophosphate kinase